jgi:hypothetical protein
LHTDFAAWYKCAKYLNLEKVSSIPTELLGLVARPRCHRIEANGPSGAVMLGGA